MLLDAFEKVNKLFHPNFCRFFGQDLFNGKPLAGIGCNVMFSISACAALIVQKLLFMSQAKDNFCRGSDSPNVACRKFVSRNDCRLVVCFLSKI